MGACIVLLVAATGRAAIQPGQVLVVYNSPSPGASEILSAYLATHPGIPADPGQNVFDLNDSSLAGMADVSYAEFITKIRDPIRAYFNASGTPSASSIIAIVLIRGIPHRIQDTDNPNAGDAPNQQVSEFNDGDATSASVDAELALLWQNLETGENGGTMDSFSDNIIVNPYFGSSAGIDTFSRNNITTSKTLTNVSNQYWDHFGGGPSRLREGDIYLVCRLDGHTVDDVLAMIARGPDITVNRRYARILIDEDDGPKELDGDDYEQTTAALLADDWWVIYDDTANFIMPAEQPRPMIAYASYGANHSGETPPSTYLQGFSFARGAVFNTIESYNARAFNGLGTLFGQEQIANFIAEGGTLGVGSVWEPFDITLPANEPLLVNYLINRMTWAEAAWSSLPFLSWQQVVVGDPLASVVAVIDQPGDFDVDGDVDADDADYLRNCALGPDVPVTQLICQDGLLDDDDDIDQTDFAILQRCITGPDLPPDPNCMD